MVVEQPLHCAILMYPRLNRNQDYTYGMAGLGIRPYSSVSLRQASGSKLQGVGLLSIRIAFVRAHPHGGLCE